MSSNVVSIAADKTGDTAKAGDAIGLSQQRPPSLDAFLADIEKRAYRTALFTTRNSADALDIVQDAMMQLVQNYRTRPSNEWILLFQRILQNRIMDWHRQQTTRRKWFWQSTRQTDEAEDDIDLLDSIVDSQEIDPAKLLERARDMDIVLASVEKLPLRQRQAFLLRAWEGLDVAETAGAMECSEGAVKSHYFRALQAIKQALGDMS